MGFFFIFFYFLFSVLVAVAGKRTSVGFWGVLAMCLLLTPLLVAILIAVLSPRERNL